MHLEKYLVKKLPTGLSWQFLVQAAMMDSKEQICGIQEIYRPPDRTADVEYVTPFQIDSIVQ